MNMILEITLRLFVALLLGGVIGIEREYRSKEAGFRTHFLVALGSALFCFVSQYGFGFDLSRFTHYMYRMKTTSNKLITNIL